MFQGVVGLRGQAGSPGDRGNEVNIWKLFLHFIVHALCHLALVFKVDFDFDKDSALNIEPKTYTMWVMRYSYQLSLQ